MLTPPYQRNHLKTKIVHLGFGAFYRAHQGVYTDILARDHQSDWGCCVVSLNSGAKTIADLNHQNRLYTVAEMSRDGWAIRRVGIVTQALQARIDGLESILAALSLPDVAIISLTITEKGYYYSATTGRLIVEHPIIAADLLHPEDPVSAIGVIVAGLARRKALGLPGVSVMSCDNMPSNGEVTRNAVLAYAGIVDSTLAQWIENNVSFPSTMVDRIVPAMNEQTLAAVANLTGYDDPVAVVCEPFRQWVIEDNFISGRPAWEKAGAELVEDVIPFEEMKLRMLNGSHSFLAYLGYLAGYSQINICMDDAEFRQAALAFMLKEQAVTLKVTGVDLNLYAENLLSRYENPALAHRTQQIAMDGSQKLPQRMLDSIRWHLRHGSPWPLLALGVAGWMRYVSGVDEDGNIIEIGDPLHHEIADKVRRSEQGDPRVQTLLQLTAIFGEDLPKNQEFVLNVTDAYRMLLEKGARRTVKHYVTAVKG